MSIPQYHVGSAAAQTLSRLGNLHHPDAVQLRPVDMVNISGHCLHEALELLTSDADKARDLLITGASRMIRAAEMLEAQINGVPVTALVAA
ncbi:MAG: hypothetical protein ABIV36_22555 [Sphingobium limneticum]